MKSSFAITLVASLCLVMLGCSEANLVEPESESLAVLQSSSAAPASMPVVAYRESGRLVPTNPTDDPQADLDVECDDGWFELFSRKDAIATHLGTVYGFENACLNPATGEVDNTGINIGADGSSMTFDAACNLTSETEFLCHLTVTGGTGRLANASTLPGEPIEVTGTIDASTGNVEYSSAGRISI